MTHKISDVNWQVIADNKAVMQLAHIATNLAALLKVMKMAELKETNTVLRFVLFSDGNFYIDELFSEQMIVEDTMSAGALILARKVLEERYEVELDLGGKDV